VNPPISWLKLFVFNPIAIFISAFVLLNHGDSFYLLRPLSWTIYVYLNKGSATDSEYMEADTKPFDYLPLYDLDRGDSEPDILSYNISLLMWGYPVEVNLTSFSGFWL
jgi:hypothetical protein